MKLLRAAEAPCDRRELVVRHGRVASVVLFLALAAPLAFVLTFAPRLVHGMPWFAWIFVGPVAALVGLVMLVALVSLAQIVARSFTQANWHARVRSTSIDLNLRSYQNAHFPDDAPTIVRLEFAEIASVRRVRERWVDRGRKRTTPHVARWLEFELRHDDTRELARALRHERERPAPQTRFLGITSRGRFEHVTVLVTEDGRVRALDISSALRRELARRVAFGEELNVDLDQAAASDLDSRVRARIDRGDLIGATSLVRREMNVSLTEARNFVEELRRAA